MTTCNPTLIASTHTHTHSNQDTADPTFVKQAHRILRAFRARSLHNASQWGGQKRQWMWKLAVVFLHELCLNETLWMGPLSFRSHTSGGNPGRNARALPPRWVWSWIQWDADVTFFWHLHGTQWISQVTAEWNIMQKHTQIHVQKMASAQFHIIIIRKTEMSRCICGMYITPECQSLYFVVISTAKRVPEEQLWRFTPSVKTMRENYFTVILSLQPRLEDGALIRTEYHCG